jgi:hypothetical protein
MVKSAIFIVCTHDKVCTGRRDFMAFTFSRKCELLPECTGVDACSIDNMDLEIVAEYNWDPTWDCSGK